MKGKRGSLILESAFVLPIVILTVFFLLSLSIHFYGEVCAQTEHFSELRNAAKAEGTTTYGEAKFVRDMDLLVEGIPQPKDGE